MHSANFRFADAHMRTHLQCMIDLLQEPALQNYTAVNLAINEINQIQNADIDINDAAVIQQERNTWKYLIAAQTTNRKMFRTQLKKIFDSNKDLRKRLGDVYTELKQDIDDVKRLLGNDRTHAFLDTLQLKRTLCLKTLVKLVVQRERRKESKIDVMNRSTAHKASTLLLVMILYESRQADLWSHVSDYVLNGKHELDLGGQHISPSELHALAYVLPETGITSLNLAKCGLSGKEAEHLFEVLGRMQQLTKLCLHGNEDLHGPTLTTALCKSLMKLTNLDELDLGACQMTDEDADTLAKTLPVLRKLEVLILQANLLSDRGALKVTKVVVTLPRL
ncbi:hypothetical protein LSAT2_027606 [Lamellibrachia satsuma]|nr:hypothetical protein LSAT2_027606 [Lamellibrachia satsuma]